MHNRHIAIIFIALFALACYFPLFFHLDHMSLRQWDESRRGVNAYEMLNNGNLLVTYFDGQPDMWGTKPPLLIWCQAFFMKMIGPNEIAIRLPSALAGLFTILMMILFSWRVLKRPVVGFLAGLVLLTTKGYVINGHVARSGDFDALLTLWETGYLLSFFTFLIKDDTGQKRKLLYLTAGFVALAGLTKGVAGFFFLPGIALFFALYGMIDKSRNGFFTSFFKSKHTWIAIMIAIIPIISFYLLREAYNPGYLTAVQENELGGRYLATQHQHRHNWWFYFEELWDFHYKEWLPFLPLGLMVGFVEKGTIRTFTSLLLLNSLVFFIIISAAQTRIAWYMAPIYPTFALLVGLGLDALVNGASRQLTRLIIVVFVFGVFFLPYRSIMNSVYRENHPIATWESSKYRDFIRLSPASMPYTIVHNYYNAQIHFYAKLFNDNGYKISHQALEDFNSVKHQFGTGSLDFSEGDILMVCEESVFTALDKVYKYKKLNEWEGCMRLEILERITLESGTPIQ